MNQILKVVRFLLVCSFCQKKRFLNHLELLEAIEITIHRNNERDLKNSPGERFDIGDNVLVKNPDMKTGQGIKKIHDPFLPLTVIAKVVEVSPSSMYKLNFPDGDSFYQKNLFEGEMVLFEKKTITRPHLLTPPLLCPHVKATRPEKQY